MLKTIFDLLRTWSKVNVRNFFSQLEQFYSTYSYPCVHDGITKSWDLTFGVQEVHLLFTEFVCKLVCKLPVKTYCRTCLIFKLRSNSNWLHNLKSVRSEKVIMSKLLYILSGEKSPERVHEGKHSSSVPKEQWKSFNLRPTESRNYYPTCVQQVRIKRKHQRSARSSVSAALPA